MEVPTKLSSELLNFRLNILKRKDFLPSTDSKSFSVENYEIADEPEEEEIATKRLRHEPEISNSPTVENEMKKTFSSENLQKNTKSELSKRIALRPRRKLQVLCRFFLTNSCTRGDDCAFSHEISKFPCQDFHLRKNCNKKLCSYSHEPVTVAEYNKMKEKDMREKKTYISPFQ